MSLNYFIETRDIEMVFDLGKRVVPIHNKRVFECHICQTMGGLKPLFEIHSYDSFEELKELLTNGKYEFKIVDDYGTNYTVKDFLESMERENSIGKTRCNHLRQRIAHDFTIDEKGFEFIDCDFS